MSETSETKGRCRQQIEAWYANNSSSVPRYSWMIADAIDRLAADVESVMEMTREIALRVPSEFGQDACDVAVRVALKERDAAVRERDQWREEARLAVINRDEARAEVESLRESIGAANRLFGAEQAKVERLRNELEQRQPDGNSPEIQDSSSAVTEPAQDASEEIAELKFWVEKYRVKAEAYGGVVRGCAPALERAGHPVNGRGRDGAVGGIARAVEALICERDEARAEVERLKAELAARPAANSSEIPDSSPADPPPAAPAAGWLTEREQHALRHILAADVEPVIRSILSRAGSPPVVEVPAISRRDVPMQNEAFAYRAALDKAGVKWKEVGRE